MTHQTYSHEGRAYVSPFKRAVVDDSGTLRFGWWAPNERLKGTEQPPPEPRGATLGFVSRSVGAIVEATLLLPPAAAAPPDAAQLPGFVIETTSGGAVIATVDARGHAALATVRDAVAPANATALQWGTFDRDLALTAGAAVAVRLLCRRDMLELYLDDVLFPVYLMPTTTGRVGLLPHASALISGARLWQMSLPADDEHKAARAFRSTSEDIVVVEA